MPLNYSKWDQLELSDDSDIEGHPNVDKKSLIRWKQRDIHEKREARNHRINEIDAEISCNNILLDRLSALKTEISQSAGTSGASRFSSEVERLRTNPSPDAPPTNAPNQVTYDAMLLQLLEPLAVEAREKAAGDQDKLVALLEEKLAFHVTKLGEVTEERRKEMEELLKEKAKHITAEDIHEGWESKYTPTPSTSAPEKSTSTSTSKSIEVLNPGSSSSQPPAKSISNSEDLDDLPEMTPSLEGFAQIPLWDFEASQAYIQNHRDVVVPGSSDALLVAAFTAQTEGKSKYAKQCVHQSLLLQYGDKLGKDGLRLFFKRMIEGGQKAHAIFRKDVEDTFAHIVRRVEAQKLESPAVPSETEQIQLVAENPETTISFNVPDGPPPENIQLEGPGTEDLDVEEVKKALQLRWDLFQGLSAELQEALKTGELAEVNKVLGNMGVAQAEQEVKMMDMGGILNFAGEGIRDMTGEAEGDDEDEDEEVEEEAQEGEEVKAAA